MRHSGLASQQYLLPSYLKAGLLDPGVLLTLIVIIVCKTQYIIGRDAQKHKLNVRDAMYARAHM